MKRIAKLTGTLGVIFACILVFGFHAHAQSSNFELQIPTWSSGSWTTPALHPGTNDNFGLVYLPGFGYEVFPTGPIAGSTGTPFQLTNQPPTILPLFFVGRYNGSLFHMHKGTYVYDGTFSFLVLKNRTYVGKIVVQDQTFYIQGNTPPDGHIERTVLNSQTKPLSLDLYLMGYPDNTVGCTGTLSNGVWLLGLLGKQSR